MRSRRAAAERDGCEDMRGGGCVKAVRIWIQISSVGSRSGGPHLRKLTRSLEAGNRTSAQRCGSA